MTLSLLSSNGEHGGCEKTGMFMSEYIANFASALLGAAAALGGTYLTLRHQSLRNPLGFTRLKD